MTVEWYKNVKLVEVITFYDLVDIDANDYFSFYVVLTASFFWFWCYQSCLNRLIRVLEQQRDPKLRVFCGIRWREEQSQQ